MSIDIMLLLEVVKHLVFSLQVDFIWINRDQKSFEWFVSLLTKLEMDQADEEPEGERETPGDRQ